jgi:hypothetical protein
MSSNFMFLRMHLSKIITSDGQRLNGVRRVSLFFHMDHSPFDVFKNSTVFAIWTAALCPPLHIVFPLSLFTKYVPAYHVSAVLSGVQRSKKHTYLQWHGSTCPSLKPSIVHHYMYKRLCAHMDGLFPCVSLFSHSYERNLRHSYVSLARALLYI